MAPVLEAAAEPALGTSSPQAGEALIEGVGNYLIVLTKSVGNSVIVSTTHLRLVDTTTFSTGIVVLTYTHR